MMRFVRCFLFAGLSLASCVRPGRAATYTAASCNLADVQAAIRAEQATPADGDVIVIPAGTCTWTGSTPVLAKFSTSVTIQGAGAVYATDGGASTTGTDRTVIFDSITHSGSTPESLRITTAPGKSLRLTGIAILQNASSSPANHAIVEIDGTSTAVRIDHCHFYMQMGSYQLRFDGPLGVLDHNYFEGTAGWGGIQMNLPGSDGAGHASWNEADQLGTAAFLFLEDNRFDRSGIGDSHAGARYVLRHNTIVSDQSKAPQMYNHGLNPSGRSMRAAEVYLNTFVETYPKGVNQPTYSNNGGTLLYWGNIVSGYTYLVDIDYMRKDSGIYNYGTPPTGWGTCSTTAGTGWDLKGVAPSGYTCMDQPGRGAGDLLSGWFPNLCNQTQGCSSYYGQWPRQTVSPIYIWNNSFTPASGYWPATIAHNLTAVVSENRDYYQQFGATGAAGTFDGSKGIGQGLSSTMPAVCTAGPGGNTPGVGYWATDKNTLYVCSSTNRWSAYYTPFTYPHPLTQSAGTVTPPPSLTAIVQ